MINITTRWDGDIVSAAINGAAADALNHAAEYLRSASLPLVPYQDGDLENSLQVTPATPENLTSHVSADTPYAVRQHEELDWVHPIKGEAKYLEKPLIEESDKIMQAIASRLGGAIP